MDLQDKKEQRRRVREAQRAERREKRARYERACPDILGCTLEECVERQTVRRLR
jgi:hypothetical protein